MIQVWRIATDAPTYTADDLSGEGARLSGGRWNRPGLPIVYCASSPALACLETLVHLPSGGLPLNRYLIEILIPDNVWANRKGYQVQALPVGWDALPAGKVSLDFGDEWLQLMNAAVMQIPSVISPEDPVILLNPAHPDMAKIKAKKLRKWLYDPRVTLPIR